jgi:hypothetical protein
MRKPPGRAESSCRFNFGALDPETRQFIAERAEKIRELTRETVAGVLQIGRYLTETKERLGHGNFSGWIDCEFGWAERSAQRFMSVFEYSKSANLADLKIDLSSLYLIAAPKTPGPVRNEVIRRAGNGETVRHREVVALVQRTKEGQPKRIDPAEARLREMEDELLLHRRNGRLLEPDKEKTSRHTDWRELSPLYDFLQWAEEHRDRLPAIVRTIQDHRWAREFAPRVRQARALIENFDGMMIQCLAENKRNS